MTVLILSSDIYKGGKPGKKKKGVELNQTLALAWIARNMWCELSVS